MSAVLIGPPDAHEYAAFYSPYLGHVAHHPDALAALEEELPLAVAVYEPIGEERSRHRYDPCKWSLREVLGHIVDSERVLAYRALAFARGEEAALPGFDQDAYLAGAEFDRRPWSSLIEEFALVRRTSIALFAGLPSAGWRRSGAAWNHRVSVRALGYIIAGHEAHHRAVVRARYLG